MTNAAAARDFTAATVKALARKGVTLLSPVALPDMSSAMPYANASRGYSVNDNGTGRILSFADVLNLARN